ncbi:thioredoxin family protein [soil metagenome]
MEEYIENSITFPQYESLIDGLLAEGKTTGKNQSEAMVGYGKLNRQRMHRLEKTVVINEELRTAAQNLARPMIWLVITEGWCGDAAQNVPVIEKIAAESDKIKTRYILRDENLDLMDRFLTNGTRSIPKLIALDSESLEVLGSWGPRPAAAQEFFAKMTSNGTEKAVILEEMQRWYNADKGQSIQHEFAKLLSGWEHNHTAAAGK